MKAKAHTVQALEMETVQRPDKEHSSLDDVSLTLTKAGDCMMPSLCMLSCRASFDVSVGEPFELLLDLCLLGDEHSTNGT